MKPWRRTIRRRTLNEALSRLAAAPAGDVWKTDNSYLGLLRQATHSHTDRARVGRLVLKRGHCVNGALTKAYR